MLIGVPKELKNNENRVGLTPASLFTYVEHGHQVWVETGAGWGSGFSDEDYRLAGARIVETAQEAWSCDMVIKVKEPLLEEYHYFRKDLLLYTYLHLAAEPKLTEALVQHNVTAIAYETIQLEQGTLPLLTPMSEVAGRMSIQLGAQFLEQAQGGKGILLGGVPGVAPAHVVIVGGGIVGTNAAKIAVGLGAHVTILDVNVERLRYLDDLFQGRVTTLRSEPYLLAKTVEKADLLVGAVLIPGAKAPRLVSEEMVQSMQPGSVIIDVAIDQGGSIETIDRITTHSNPTYVKHGVVHYAVANMPGAVPRTSTIALNNVTVYYGLQIADKGYQQAALENQAIARGINVMNGVVTHPSVAKALGYEYIPLERLFSD